MRVDEKLQEKLRPWDWAVLVVSVISLVLIIWETFVPLPPDTLNQFILIDRCACAIFMVDVLVRWRRMDWSKKYWKWGWLDVLAAIPLDAAFRAMQAIRIYRFVRLARIIYKFKGVTKGTTLNEKLLAMPGIALVMTLFSTTLIVEVESEALNPLIKSGGDAIWWALSTVTTVGYGDMYPVTTKGRFLAALLMLVGIALFGSISAYITSKFILPKEARDHENELREIRALHKEVKELRQTLMEHDNHASKKADVPPSTDIKGL
jgi:voltage-gated potassium channel